MKKKLLTGLLFTSILANSFCANAYDFSATIKKKKKQKKETNSLFGIGWGSLVSFGSGGKFSHYDVDTSKNIGNANLATNFGLDILFIGAQYHYTIKKIDNDNSISFHTFPTFGLNVTAGDGNFGFGNIQVPVFINYNKGGGATAKSKEDNGLTLGLGFEYIRLGLLYSAGSKSSSIYNNSSYKSTYSILQPAVNVGYRYINDSDLLREWNLKIGYRPNKIADAFGNASLFSPSSSSSFWLRLSLTYYME